MCTVHAPQLDGIASDVGSCQTKLITKRVNEQQARLHLKVVLDAVDVQAN